MIAGIDPGAGGAVAWLDDDGSFIAVEDLPIVEIAVGKGKRRRLVPALLAEMLRERRPAAVFLEEVGTLPRDGNIVAFSLGRNFGQIEGVLSTLRISYTHVRPQDWKKQLKLTADKELSRMRAVQMWPAQADRFKFKKNADRAEACLLALYGVGAVQQDYAA